NTLAVRRDNWHSVGTDDSRSWYLETHDREFCRSPHEVQAGRNGSSESQCQSGHRGEPCPTATANAHRNAFGFLERRRPVQEELRITDVAQPLFRIFIEERFEKKADGRWSLGRQGFPFRLAFEDLRKNLGCRFSGKGLLSVEHFVNDAAEGPVVGPRV